MAEVFEYEYPVGRDSYSSFVRELIEDPTIGHKIEDFSYDTESIPMVTVTSRLEEPNEAELIMNGVRRCAYNTLTFNITG